MGEGGKGVGEGGKEVGEGGKEVRESGKVVGEDGKEVGDGGNGAGRRRVEEGDCAEDGVEARDGVREREVLVLVVVVMEDDRETEGLSLGVMEVEERGRRGSGKGCVRAADAIGFDLSSNFEKFPGEQSEWATSFLSPSLSLSLSSSLPLFLPMLLTYSSQFSVQPVRGVGLVAKIHHDVQFSTYVIL